MAEVLVKIGGFFLLFSCAAWVGHLWRKASSARDVRALPPAHERLELIATVRTMRAEGASLQECVEHLRSQGIRTGVARGLVIDVEREQRADVATPLEREWNGYVFRYPANWKTTDLNGEEWPAPGLSVEGIGSGITLLVPLVGEDGYREILASQEEQLTRTEQRPTQSWGRFEGEGVVMKGEHATMRLAMEVTVFRPEVPENALVIVQGHALEESELVAPGLELIEATLAPVAARPA